MLSFLHPNRQWMSSSRNRTLLLPPPHNIQIQQERAMLKASLARSLSRLLLGASVTALALSQSVRAEDGRDRDDAKNPIEQIKTASPIKHVIVVLGVPGGDPGLAAADQFLFGTGGTGLAATLGPDTRITNVNTLPPGPFQMTGATMPYDAYTADTIHQFFQMYQQMDCAIDKEHA